MRKLDGIELTLARKHLSHAQDIAKKATCQQRKCGAVVVRNDEILGIGYNSPPRNLESQRRCHINKSDLHEKITDNTCCVHAERRAISKAVKKTRGTLNGATIYFTSVNEKGNRLPSGDIYCTDCSKNSLDECILEWVLERKDGVYAYSAEEFNNISYSYGKNSDSTAR